MRDYRRLLVWQKAHALLLAVYKELPRTPRRYASLVGQITRATESIPTNIVEGRAADSDAEFARFLKISLKSSTELEYLLELGVERGMIDKKTFDRLQKQILEVRAMLSGLIRKLKDDDRSGPGRVQD